MYESMNTVKPKRLNRHSSGVGTYYKASQQGVVLVVSLVLMVAMTILGVATLSGTRLNELIASNTQQKSIAFEAAESAIESVSRHDFILTAITSDDDNAGNDPDVIVLPDSQSQLAETYDLLNEGRGINIDGTLSVQYCGESQPIGTNLNATLGSGQIAAIMVDINSQIDIANSSASADHLKRVSLLTPQTGRTGDCTVR